MPQSHYLGGQLLLPPFLYPIFFLLSNPEPAHTWKDLCCEQVRKRSGAQQRETEAQGMRFLKAKGEVLKQEQGIPPSPSSMFFQQDSAQLSLVMCIFK